jgi:hypothetical protein
MTDPVTLTRTLDDVRDDLTDIGFTLQKLRGSYRLDTSQLPDQWSVDNPRTGQCHVASLIINERHGGRILLGYTRANELHYWNVVHGITIDATRDQFLAATIFDRIEDATDEVLGESTLFKRDLLAERAFGLTA